MSTRAYFGRGLCLAALSTLILAMPLSAAQRIEPETSPPAPVADGLIDETPNLWFVQLKSAPAVDGTSIKTLKKEKDAFKSAAANAGLKYKVRYSFDTLWNGLSVEIDPAMVGRLSLLDGVTGVYPVIKFMPPEPTSASNPDLFTALSMTGADIAQSSLGLTGEGVKLAVMDTGIDYDHPDLGGCFGDGCRVAYGYDFVGDDFGSTGHPVPDDDPDDCQGHGTHVAGIAGANGTVTGVAPDVTFGAYRVFGCTGSTYADIMIMAMEAALADGMDILNMSIGAAYQWPQYPTALASNRLVNAGMVVVASIGNSGAYGTYATGAPGVGKKVIGVASFDNIEIGPFPYFEVNGANIGYDEMTYSLPAPISGTEEIVYIGLACNGYPLDADPSGKVALISRGDCSFADKATNALGAGATAAVVHNNAPGIFYGTLGSPIGVVAVSISQEDGMLIRSQAAPVMMTWTDQTAMIPNPTGGLIAAGSSHGLAPDLSLKPDIGAPGGGIYSTYPLEKGGYATLGGTSMASPHVAGAAALLLQARPKTPSQAVRRIFQNSADPAPWSLAPGYGLLDHVHRQGAGMLDVDDAIMAKTVIEPGKIALGESEHGPSVHSLEIENNGPDPVTYDLSYVSAVATTGTWADDLGYWLTGEFVDFSVPSVTVPAGETAVLNATFYPALAPDMGTYGGYLVFTPQDGGEPLRVPYAGFVGDYQDLPVLDANPYGLPWFMPCTGPCTMEPGSQPEIWVNLGHQVRKFRMEVFEAGKDKSWHRAYDYDYVGRNSNYNNIYTFPWDGYTMGGKKIYEVPDGDYYLVISVQKALGDDDNPDHWETWTSPTFTIERP